MGYSEAVDQQYNSKAKKAKQANKDQQQQNTQKSKD